MINPAAKSLIYFARLENGNIKIGSTTQLKQRMWQIKGKLVYVMEGSCFRESAVHFLMREAHIKGEEFREGVEIYRFIESVRAGDYCGLIDDLPRTWAFNSPGSYHGDRKEERCFRMARVALGLSIEQVAEDCGISLSTARGADGSRAPGTLSGRVVQYIVQKATEQGVGVNSHHFTGIWDDDLRYQLSLAKKPALEAAE